MNSWDHKDEWRRQGKDFLIVISRHSSNLVDHYEGPNRWAVYAYIYPAHSNFSSFKGPDMWQSATDIGFHGGCTMLCYHYDESGKVMSIQCGGDYNHLHDGRFTDMGSSADAREVFSDADALFETLTRLGAADGP